MKVVYSEAHLLHNPDSETYDGALYPIAEYPERAEVIKGALIEAGHQLVAPNDYDNSSIAAVHTQRYIDYISAQSAAVEGQQDPSEWVDGDGIPHMRTRPQRHTSNYISDSYTPLTHDTFDAAVAAAHAAETSADLLIADGETSYALCRPPGHHAEKQRMGGYCFFNNVAIAANKLSRFGKVAVLDIDFHHGNGTQDIFYDRDDVMFVSLHAHPDNQYPYLTGREDEIGIGDGRFRNMNLPLANGMDANGFYDALQRGLDAIDDFAPSFLAVSVGYDTYRLDPIAGSTADFRIDINDFRGFGLMIRELSVPTMLVQEGGYYVPDLGKLASAFVGGFENQT